MGGLSEIIKALWMSYKEAKESVLRSGTDLKMLYCGFEDGEKGPWTKECRQLLKAGKDKETDSPLQALEGTHPWRHLDVDLVSLIYLVRL